MTKKISDLEIYLPSVRNRYHYLYNGITHKPKTVASDHCYAPRSSLPLELHVAGPEAVSLSLSLLESHPKSLQFGESVPSFNVHYLSNTPCRSSKMINM